MSIKPLTVSSNDPRVEKLRDLRLQAMAEPDEENYLEVISALKEAVETLAQLRGDSRLQAVTIQDMVNVDLIELLPNGTIQNKLPFGNPTVNAMGLLKFCDGVTEDFGKGMGWYYRRPDDPTSPTGTDWVKLWDDEDLVP